MNDLIRRCKITSRNHIVVFVFTRLLYSQGSARLVALLASSTHKAYHKKIRLSVSQTRTKKFHCAGIRHKQAVKLVIELNMLVI